MALGACQKGPPLVPFRHQNGAMWSDGTMGAKLALLVPLVIN